MDFDDDDAEFNAAAGAILAITSATATAIAQSFDSSCGGLALSERSTSCCIASIAASPTACQAVARVAGVIN